MRQGKAAMNFRLRGILRGEEGVKFLFGIDCLRVGVTKLRGPLEQIALDGIENTGDLRDEFFGREEFLRFHRLVATADGDLSRFEIARPQLNPHRDAFFDPLPILYPSPEIATVHGGGLIASGPAGKDRLPMPWAPAGLHLTGLEGAGEVQTPLTGHPAALLAIGDLVWFRHAKSGELFEHTNSVRLLSGDRFVDEVPTYRGRRLVF